MKTCKFEQISSLPGDKNLLKPYMTNAISQTHAKTHVLHIAAQCSKLRDIHGVNGKQSQPLVSHEFEETKLGLPRSHGKAMAFCVVDMMSKNIKKEKTE